MDTRKKEEGSSIEGSSGEERDVEEIMIEEALKNGTNICSVRSCPRRYTSHPVLADNLLM